MIHDGAGMNSTLFRGRAGGVGAVLAALSGALIFLLPHDMAREFLAIVMTLIGAAYFGFAFSQRDRRAAVIEVVVASAFVMIALLGLWVSVWFIVGGLFLHGVWDLMHHRHGGLAAIPAWYIPFCVWYDWLAAAIVAVWMLRL
jgi:hypothetical protein